MVNLKFSVATAEMWNKCKGPPFSKFITLLGLGSIFVGPFLKGLSGNYCPNAPCFSAFCRSCFCINQHWLSKQRSKICNTFGRKFHKTSTSQGKKAGFQAKKISFWGFGPLARAARGLAEPIRCLAKATRCLAASNRCLAKATRCLAEPVRCLAMVTRCLVAAIPCLAMATRCLSEPIACLVKAARCLEEAIPCLAMATRCLTEPIPCPAKAARCLVEPAHKKTCPLSVNIKNKFLCSLVLPIITPKLAVENKSYPTIT